MLNIAIPEDIILSTRQTHKQFEQEAKLAIALKFYVDEKLSLGQAAAFSGLNKAEFMRFLGKNNVSIFRFENGIEELQHGIANAGMYANE